MDTTYLEAIEDTPQLRRLPVIVLTGSNRSVDIVTCYRTHANAHVPKPSTLEESSRSSRHSKRSGSNTHSFHRVRRTILHSWDSSRFCLPRLLTGTESSWLARANSYLST